MTPGHEKTAYNQFCATQATRCRTNGGELGIRSPAPFWCVTVALGPYFFETFGGNLNASP